MTDPSFERLCDSRPNEASGGADRGRLQHLGSSLAVYSGFRFARRAAADGRPIAIVNQGPTRADDLALEVRLDARLGELLPRLVSRLEGGYRVRFGAV